MTTSLALAGRDDAARLDYYRLVYAERFGRKPRRAPLFVPSDDAGDMPARGEDDER